MLEIAFPVRLQSVSSPTVHSSLAYRSSNLLRDHRHLLWNWICLAAEINDDQWWCMNEFASGSALACLQQ
eukprot:1158942-Pelagomonas_calceolata.AAC.7